MLVAGLSAAQGLSLGMQFGVEPEWPPCPPPSLATSPFTAYAPGSAESALAAQLARSFSLDVDSTPKRLDLQLTGIDSCDAADDCLTHFGQTRAVAQKSGASPQQPRAPAPSLACTPMQTPGAKQHTSPTLSLSAESILTAIELAHEQLRSATAGSNSQSACSSSSHVTRSPVVAALGRLTAAANRSNTPFSSGSPAVKTTRQVPSVLAAVAQLEAAQKGDGRCKLPLPAKLDNSRFQTPSGPQIAASAAGENSNVKSAHAVPAVTQLANPLFSPSANASGTTPFFTPLGMNDMMLDSCITPAGGNVSPLYSRLAAAVSSPPLDGSSIGKWRENLAGRLNTPVGAGLAAPGTPGSGVVTVGWRSVTERLQTLRVQLQSAQKKLASASQV